MVMRTLDEMRVILKRLDSFNGTFGYLGFLVVEIIHLEKFELWQIRKKTGNQSDFDSLVYVVQGIHY
jgi:hypothetical protein